MSGSLPLYNGGMSFRHRVMMFAVAYVLACACAGLSEQIVVSQDGNGDFSSIQRAIDAASYGDTVFVNPGTYVEPIALKHGVSLIGAGASHTKIESSYGYDSTLRAVSVSAVTIEGLTIERAPSILEAAALSAEASQLVISDCVIIGGRPTTIQVSGGLSSVELIDSTIDATEGSGLTVTNGGTVALRNALILDAVEYGLLLEDSEATADGGAIRYCGLSGVAVDGVSTLTLRNLEILACARYAMEIHGNSIVSFESIRVEKSGFGSLTAAGTASISGRASTLVGGNVGIQISENAQLSLEESTISAAEGEGVSARDNTSLDFQQCEIVQCDGTGIAAETTGTLELSYVTIASNAAHGIDLQQGSLALSHSIVALNDGVGVRVSSNVLATQQSAFNVVWGNGIADYEGMSRPPTDSAQPPGFKDPNGGDFSFTMNARSLSAGQTLGIVGAGLDPNLVSSTWLSFSARAFQNAGAPLTAGFHLNASAVRDAQLRASWLLPIGGTTLKLSGTLERSLRFRGQGRYAVPVSSLFAAAGDHSQFGISGALDGAQSWWRAWGDFRLVLGPLSSDLWLEYEGSTGLTRESLSLGLASFELRATATQLVPGQLSASWLRNWTEESGHSRARISLEILPSLRATANYDWEDGSQEAHWETRIELHEWGTGSMAWSWDEARASVEVRVRSKLWSLEDAQVRGALSFGWLELGAMLGMHSIHGLRAAGSVSIDLSRLSVPNLNEPPAPEFSYLPLEPEAGETIEFDATASHDPDGTLDQIWWDFDDGTTGIGAIATHQYDLPGEYAVTLMLSDDAGDATTLTKTVLVHAADTTPIASFVWAPATDDDTRLLRPLRVGDRVLLDALASRDPDGSIAEYSWDIESDGVFDHTSTTPVLVIDPLPAGSWPVTLRVIDDTGRTDAVMRVLQVTEPKPPQAQFEVSPKIPATLDPIRFLDHSIPGDADIVSWRWDFGDGQGSESSEPVHRFREAGEYLIHLEVVDAEDRTGAIETLLEVVVNPTVVPVSEVWSLVIGISDYSDVEDLSFASKDAEAMAQWLLDVGVPSSNIRLLTDQQQTLENGLESRVASLVNVREALGWLRQHASQDDLVLIHFSGHGYQGADDGTDEADGLDEFFVLHDTRATARDDTALRDDEFGRFLDRIASEHVLVFFDSCYSGGLSRSLTPGEQSESEAPDLFTDLALEGRLILSASEEGSDAFESPQLEHGVFTYFLLQGLRGAADLNEDGHVTVWELHEHTRQTVPDFVLEERGERQIPQLIGEGDARIMVSSSMPEAPESE